MRAIIEGVLKFPSVIRPRGTRWLQCGLCAARNIVYLVEQGRNGSIRASIAVLAMTWALSGCSPYIYQKEVGSFNSSVAAVSNGVTQGLNNLDQDQAAADLAPVIQARSGVNLDPECGTDSLKLCRLIVPGQAINTSAADKFAPGKPELRKVLTAMKAYADGLTAVTNAQDRKDYDAAASQLSSSVAALGTSAGAAFPGGAAAGPALGALVTLTTWSIGTGLDAARYDTLKSAINAVETQSADLGNKSAIQVAVDEAITPTLNAVRTARLELLYAQLKARRSRINFDLSATDPTHKKDPAHISLDRYDTPLTDLASLVATLNAVKGVDPKATGKSLLEAHSYMQKAVNDKSKQFQTLISSMADFADKAAAVEKAFAKQPTK